MTVPYLTVIMIGGTPGNVSISPVTVVLTLRNTPIVQRTPRPCPGRVIDVTVQWLRYVRVVFVLVKVMVKYYEGIHTLPWLLTYQNTNLLTVRRGVLGVKSGVGILHVLNA